MKMKIVAKIIESAIGSFVDDEKPRADMYLPIRALAIAIALVIGSGVALAYYFFSNEIVGLIFAPMLLILAIAMFMCWKNQTITIIDEETFEYKTFLGNKKVIAFADITDLRKNNDSLTLYAGTEKIHIESMAIMTPRLKDKINEALSAR